MMRIIVLIIVEICLVTNGIFNFSQENLFGNDIINENVCESNIVVQDEATENDLIEDSINIVEEVDYSNAIISETVEDETTENSYYVSKFNSTSITDNTSEIQKNSLDTSTIQTVESSQSTEENIYVPIEEYRYNDIMTKQIISIIENNQNEYMTTYGFTTKIDESIVSLTNYFTFSEERVKIKIQNKFGEIRVYSRDYYFNRYIYNYRMLYILKI